MSGKAGVNDPPMRVKRKGRGKGMITDENENTTINAKLATVQSEGAIELAIEYRKWRKYGGLG